MKRYSTLMDEMKKNISPYFNELTLNKVDSKYRSFANRRYWSGDEPQYTKGVDSDFILILQNKGMGLSFALAFNYIDLPKEMQTVVATVKTKEGNKNLDMIIGSKPMSLDMFKAKLVEFNGLYKDTSPGPTDQKTSVRNIIDSFSKIFIDQKLDLNQETQNAMKKREDLENQLKDELKYETIKSKHVKAQEELNKANHSITKAVNDLFEKKELERLEAVIKNLKVDLAQKKSSIEKSFSLKEKKDSFNQVEQSLAIADDKIKQQLDLFDRSLIKDVREKVKSKRRP